jgi:trimeric autotransporter adhesin
MTKYKILGLALISSFVIQAQTQEERNQIVSGYNMQTLNQLKTDFKTKEDERKVKVQNYINANPISYTITSNGNGTITNGSFQQLWDIDEQGKPLYISTFNIDAAKSTRTNHLNTGGSLGLNLNGLNYISHVWDAGLGIVTHQEHDGPGGNDRYSIGDGTTALHWHSSHVAGTILNSGFVPLAKGMASQSKVVGYDWSFDMSESVTAAQNGMLLSNHSYGFPAANVGPYCGLYSQWSSDLDALLFNAPYYLRVEAAGNDGGQSTANPQPKDGNSGYDKLNHYKISKNNLVVASADDAVVNANGDLTSVSISAFSSQGPADDYRIKPDIAGNGSGLISNDIVNNGYLNLSGTSMASPNVMGSLLLLQEHAKNVFGNHMKAATLKGLALHTSDDAGMVGPDANFGWGLLNARRAAVTISSRFQYTSIMEELTLQNGESYTFTVQSDGINPLLASISWTDRAGTPDDGSIINNSTPKLVNDLDIIVSNASTTFMPWKLSSVNTNAKGDNIVDPFERVDVVNPAGLYNITIKHKGTLVGGNQNYSLIVTGITCVTDLTVTIPANAGNTLAQKASNSITATNTISNGASGIYHAGNFVSLKPGFTSVAGSAFHAYIAGCTDTYLKSGIFTEENLPYETNNDSAPENPSVLDSNNSVSAYPNPNNGNFTLQVGNSNPKDVIIYDMLGTVIFKLNNVSDQNIDIDISQHSKGLYLVKVIDGSDIKTLKIINNN